MELHIGLLSYFPDNELYALLISLFLNIVISIAGVIPSAFITAGNVAYFGFHQGLIVSIAGEALGAIVSFYLYRKGIKRLKSNPKVKSNNLVIKLQNTKGISAFFLVIGLRILPFVPSGMVTLTASMSTMSIFSFSVASTIGKIPALYIEALSVYSVMSWEREFQWIALILAILLLCTYILLQKKKNTKRH